MRVIMTAALLVLVPLLWHEHRFWRAYEVAGRSTDMWRRAGAISRLAALGDRRALPLLRRLGAANYDAMLALASMGENDGKVALVEYARGAADPWRRASALLALCGQGEAGRGFLGDPTVRALVAAAVHDTHDGIRGAAERCAAALQRSNNGR
jgi:HEAT repeat protein